LAIVRRWWSLLVKLAVYFIWIYAAAVDEVDDIPPFPNLTAGVI